jgi:DNA polymerase III epsilon subunit-like protein
MNEYDMLSETIKNYKPIREEPPRLTMIFDTETSGLLPKGECSIDQKPYILQLSYVLYDEDKETVVEEYNHYIRLHDMTIEIDKGASEIHKISKEILNTRGIPIEEALTQFYKDYRRSTRIVGHNISFDMQMILIEVERNYHKMTANGCVSPECIFNKMYEKVHGMDHFDTMEHGIHICNIAVESNRYGKLGKDEYMVPVNINGMFFEKRMYKKRPSLLELLLQLNLEVGKLHDSIEDVYCCFRIYQKIKHVVR